MLYKNIRKYIYDRNIKYKFSMYTSICTPYKIYKIPTTTTALFYNHIKKYLIRYFLIKNLAKVCCIIALSQHR